MSRCMYSVLTYLYYRVTIPVLKEAIATRKTTAMLNLNTDILTAVIEQAKQSAANDPRWIRAIERAAAELVENPYIERDGDHLLLASPSGNAYEANGVCQCEAYKHGKPCWHRAAGRL